MKYHLIAERKVLKKLFYLPIVCKKSKVRESHTYQQNHYYLSKAKKKFNSNLLLSKCGGKKRIDPGPYRFLYFYLIIAHIMLSYKLW